MNKKSWSIVAGFFLVLFLVLFSPIFTITAINVLFGTFIEITIETWLAATWFHVLLVGRYSTANKG
jgi:hypothetical protein